MKVAYISRAKPTPLQVYISLFDTWKAKRDRSQLEYHLYTDTTLQLMCDFATLEVECQAAYAQKAAAEWTGLNAIRKVMESRYG